MTTYISPAMRAQTAAPHKIYHSFIKLFLLTALLLGTAAIAFYFAAAIQGTKPAGAPIEKSVWLLLAAGGAGLFFFLLRALPKWLVFGSPVLTISKEGLTFRGKPLMPWGEITENHWQSAGGFGLTTGAALHVRTPRQRIRRESLTFNCSAEEYMRLCELYAEGGSADPASPRLGSA